MRKVDYEILAASIKKQITDPWPALDEMSVDFQRRQSNNFVALQLGRYLAEYLHVDKKAFLEACGIKP